MQQLRMTRVLESRSRQLVCVAVCRTLHSHGRRNKEANSLQLITKMPIVLCCHRAGEHEHTIVGYSLVKGIGDGEPIASERFTVGGHEWVRHCCKSHAQHRLHSTQCGSFFMIRWILKAASAKLFNLPCLLHAIQTCSTLT